MRIGKKYTGKTRSGFPLAYYAVVCTYLGLIAFLPLAIVLAKIHKGEIVPYDWLVASLTWSAIVAISLFYLNRRCSSEQLRFFDGLVHVSRAAAMGTMNTSFAFGFFGVLIVLFGSIPIALLGEIQRKPEITKHRFMRLVSFFYRNRMVQ